MNIASSSTDFISCWAGDQISGVVLLTVIQGPKLTRGFAILNM